MVMTGLSMHFHFKRREGALSRMFARCTANPPEGGHADPVLGFPGQPDGASGENDQRNKLSSRMSSLRGTGALS
jgi:hypothetical protein